MSNLLPSLVPLDKGLNLQTAKLVAPAGTVLDSLNYEQVDFQGQKRIDGFARYDGSTLPAIDDYYLLNVSANIFAVGDLMGTATGLLGVVVGISGANISVVVIDYNLIPVPTSKVYKIVSGSNGASAIVNDIQKGVDSGVTYDQHYANLLAYTQVLRDRVEYLPGGVIGLHWFRDRLYAVADVTTVSLAGTSPKIYPNDIITIGSISAKVLDAITLTNTRVLFLDTMAPDPWGVNNAAVLRAGLGVGNVANGFELLAAYLEVASFFESRSEAQVLTEGGLLNFGWRFIDLGWQVNFEKGTSLYGSFPSLNQNIKGLGIQGPTDIAGTDGKPLLLTQKVSITGKPVQVNGWKSSQSPTTYELQSGNLDEVDTNTIYADAYITWNGTTTEVAAPGYSSEPLTEYPATNTVIIELT